jgi:FG-GAP-like repeat
MKTAAVILLSIATACSRPSPVPSTNPAWFEDVAAARGITFAHRSGHETRYLLPEIMGGGGALLDVDDDGHLDVFLVQSGQIFAAPGSPAGHRLYRNRGDGTFEDVSEASGVAAVAGTSICTSRALARTRCCRTTGVAASPMSPGPRESQDRAGAPAPRSPTSTRTATSICSSPAISTGASTSSASATASLASSTTAAPRTTMRRPPISCSATMAMARSRTSRAPRASARRLATAWG